MVVPYVDFKSQWEESKDETMAAITRVFERGDFILGDDVAKFEQEFAKFVGVKHAIGVANGTDSLIIALRCLGIGPGDEVITAPNSWVSSASSIHLVGASPVFVDVGPDFNINANLIQEAITHRTKAIMPVHLTGRMCNMAQIKRIAARYGLFVIEDAAQAVGAYSGKYHAGASGHVGSFSLHPLKNLNAAGDAGIITTWNDDLAAKIRMWRAHGMSDREHVEFFGFNSRLDTLQAAILRVRLKKLGGYIAKRRANAARYNAGLASLGGIVDLPKDNMGDWQTYHLYMVKAHKRDQLKAWLADEGIETKIHYPIPIHRQRALCSTWNGGFPECEKQSEEILSLPVHQYLSEDQINHVIDSIRRFYA